MSKYYIPRTYCCSICDESYDNELNAVDCFDSHCRDEKITNFHYDKKDKYPDRIIVEFNSNNEKKSISFIREYQEV